MPNAGASTLSKSRDADRRPRVLLVGPFPPTTGGVTTFMLRLMSSSLRERFTFVPFTTSRPPKKDTLDNWGYAAMFRGGIVRLIQGVTITAFHVAIFPFVLISRRIDIVQIQASDYQAFWEAAAYTYLARLLGKPVIFRIGGAFDIFFETSPPFVKKMIGAVVRRPQCVIAQSEMSKDFIVKAGCNRQILVLPNWAADDAVKDIARDARANALFLFIVGSDAKRKGYEDVLEAARILAARNSPARFHIVAVPPALAELIARAKLANIDAVEGFLPRERVSDAMEKADVFLIPSHGEGFPNSLIEALSCGLPAIATPVGAVPEIASGGGVQLVPAGDAAKLAEAIDLLARDGVLRVKLGAAALDNVRRRYTAAGVLPNLAALYADSNGIPARHRRGEQPRESNLRNISSAGPCRGCC